MKFLDTLAAKYEALGLEKPQWVNEQGVIPTIASAANTAANAINTISPVVNPAGAVGAAVGGGVVNALMKAMDVLKDDPEVQKVKTTVQQKINDTKKQITDDTAG
ncbi:hypothetical protein EBR43_09540 [bacterium]|nr:hypothetical protein [bacterium]